MALTNSSSRGSRERRLGGPKALFGVSFENTSCGVPTALNQDQRTTLDKLSVGQRVCVCDRPQTGEIVRVMPMTGRVVVRLDPPHPKRRGTLRSLRPVQLAICP